MAVESLLAARALGTHSVGVEVIDMRSARQLDDDAVVDSVRKTGRLLVADTAFKTGGISAEILSQVLEREFKSLKTAPVRVSLPDHPVPTSHFMADGYYPESLSIADAVLGLIGVEPETIDYSRLQETLCRSGPLDVPNKNFKGPF